MNRDRKSASFTLVGPLIIASALLLGDMAVRWVGAQPLAPPKTLSAQEFRLTDSQGATRAKLTCGPDGSPGLTLLDKAGKTRGEFGVANGAPGLSLYDSEGKLRARLTVESDGNTGLALNDRNGKLRAALRLRPDGSPVISLHDADGDNRAALETQPDGSPGLSLTNKEAKGGAALIVPSDGNPTIVFKSKDGQLLWSVPEQSDAHN